MSQRKYYIVQKEMQGKFTLTLLMLIFLVAVISFCNLYVIGQYALDNIGTFQHSETMSQMMAAALPVIGPRLVLVIVVNVIIVVIIGVFYSHQFAGPSYKLEKSIQQIAQGDLSMRIHLRKGDTMHNVADSLNQMLDNFRNVVRRAKELTKAIGDETEKLAAEEEGGPSRSVATLKGITGEMTDLLDGFKVEETPVNTAERTAEDRRQAAGRGMED